MRHKTIAINRGTLIERNTTYEGKSIEQELASQLSTGDIVLGGSEILYTWKKDGVLPETNIRTDRMERMMMANDKIERTLLNKKMEQQKKKAEAEAKSIIDKAAGKGSASESAVAGE